MKAGTAETLRHGMAAHQRGDFAGAERAYEAVLKREASNFDALHLLGMIRWQQQRFDEALSLLGRALRKQPGSAEACSNLGIVLQSVDRNAEAIASYDRAIAINPRYANAHFGRGNALSAQKQYVEALASYDRALAIAPTFVNALVNRGVALRALERHAEAVATYDRLLAIVPAMAPAHYNRGNSLAALARHEQALASYDQAIRLDPTFAEAFNNRGDALNRLHLHEQALASCDQALALRPDMAKALVNRGNALQQLLRYGEAAADYERALALDSTDADFHYNYANVLTRLARHADAIAAYERALALAPRHPYALGALADAALAICRWDLAAQLGRELETRIIDESLAVSPFTVLRFSTDPVVQLTSARNATRALPPITAPFGLVPREPGGTLRVAYLSADFHRHATAYLMAELFELHDRSRFEVIGISWGPDDGSDVRARLIKSFDRFHDVSSRSDRDAAELLHALRPDIAVDLKGHTEHARPGLLAWRPAPIQASYLGYPGTMGAEFIDYVIADATVLPFDQQPFYAEKIVHLPESYQVNDSKRPISPQVPTRREAGLPDRGFVFCCFNGSYKITAAFFDAWIRLLQANDASVLWLLRDSEAAALNLSRAAASRGVDPDRLVFAPRLGLADHLARHAVADLFLDTLPYNAHTTCSDALWAGLPVLTCAGPTFAGRVGASLLRAAGLPELVTESLEAYEALAAKLAADAPLLRSIRHKLAENRKTCPLFDTDRFRRHLETAYTTMWDLHRRGAGPRSFRVDPL